MAHTDRDFSKRDLLNNTVFFENDVEITNCSGHVSCEEQSGSPLHPSFVYICVIIGLFSIFNNVIVILAIKRSAILNQPDHKLVTSLASADMLMGFILVLIYPKIYLSSPRSPPKEYCLFTLYVITVSGLQSVLTLFLINVDRYLAVFKPLQYPQLVTERRVQVIIGTSWFVSLLSATTVLIGNKWTQNGACFYEQVVGTGALYADLIIVTVALIAIVASNGYIIHVAKRHQRMIAPLTPDSSAVVQLKRQLKLAKTFAVVVGVFVCCWGPWVMLVLANKLELYVDRFGVVNSVAQNMIFLNSALNFVIYVLKVEEFRSALKSLLNSTLKCF